MTITLSPDVLRWARLRAGLPVKELAESVGVEDSDVYKWESEGVIEAEILKHLAEFTHTPIGFLYLSTPPKEALPIDDFRTIGSTAISAPSPALLDTVYDAQRKQGWYRDHLIESGGAPLAFVGSVSVYDDTAKVAKRINGTMGLATSQRANAITKETALTAMIERVEQCGVLVLRNSAVGIDHSRKLSVSEFRGFALSDPYAPIIFVNSQDAKAAQLFTLAHELVHIWLGVSGISNLTKTYADGPSIEQFCNAVAAEMLVPAEELRGKIGTQQLTEYRIARLCTHFKVSILVMLRRLRDVGVLDQKTFQTLYDGREAHFATLASRAKLAAKQRGGGPSFYTILMPRVSPTFAQALVASTLEGRTLYREAMGLLGVSTTAPIHALGKQFGFTG